MGTVEAEFKFLCLLDSFFHFFEFVAVVCPAFFLGGSFHFVVSGNPGVECSELLGKSLLLFVVSVRALPGSILLPIVLFLGILEEEAILEPSFRSATPLKYCFPCLFPVIFGPEYYRFYQP